MILRNILWFFKLFTEYNVRLTNNTTIGPIPPNSTSSTSGSNYKETGSSNPGTFSQICIAFGSGTAAPKITDYKLESWISEGLTYTNNSCEKGTIMILTQTVTNSSSDPITISEIVTAFTNTYASACITRSVLQNPVTLQPNDIKTFTVTIDFNQFLDNTYNT